ncbi:hypothetical protein INT45_008702 [Circinella minor]|uniref:Roadblock/LAMTOR2 domain-containing protein n=1 Tax=Circinella minor TaxID=1195481 RepID=A0A8H7S6W7_9FUNG|nr:hypothetical protein INT45_008702 [Circinella minor]KAI7855625.1 hypothetical protein BDC45DRAFT_85053 [Circinella umbellata]
MLKPKVISQVLQQSADNGLKASLLMTNEGSLLAFAADNNGRSPKTYAAIAANIWSSYKQHCTSDTFLRGDPADGLRFLILDCEEGIVFVTAISSMLLCLVGNSTVELGILKAKAEAIARHLEEPLSRAASYQSYAM